MKKFIWFFILLIVFIMTAISGLFCISHAQLINLFTTPYGYNYDITTRYSIYNPFGGSQYSDYLKSVDKDVYSWVYPFPYAQLTETNWDISELYGTKSLYSPDYSYSKVNRGYFPNLTYNPTAFTVDLGLAA